MTVLTVGSSVSEICQNENFGTDCRLVLFNDPKYWFDITILSLGPFFW